MRVERITTWKELQALESAWHALAGEMPLRSWDWLTTWWKYYGGEVCRDDSTGAEEQSEKQLFVLVVYDDSHGSPQSSKRPIGIAPWYLDKSRITGSAVRWLGSGEVCTDHLSLLCCPEDADRVAEAVADALTDEFADWGHLDLSAVDVDDVSLAKFFHALEVRGCLISRRDTISCWVVDLPTNWDEYLAILSKNSRRKIRHLQRDVLTTDRVQRHVVQNEADLETAWAILVDLHQRRWQGQDEPGCFASRAFHDFHREIAGRMLDRGQLRMSWIEIDGEPSAIEYLISDSETTYLYQRGLNPDRLEDEPGWLAAILFIRAELEDGRKYIDFLRGDERYKSGFGATPRAVCDYRVIPNRRLARLRGHVWNVADSLGDWVRSRREKVMG
jgi:hypothetical protein